MKKIVLSMTLVSAFAMAKGGSGTIEPAVDVVATAVETQSSFWDRLRMKGDLRLRHEEITRDDKRDTFRERYRFRYFLDFDITDQLIFESSITSGKRNPTSGNTSFRSDEPWSDYFVDELKIDILDLAYTFDKSWIRAGLSKHFFYRPLKTQLVWDNDLRFEGVSYGYADDTRSYTLTASKLHRLENDALSTGSIYMYNGQYTHSMNLENSKLRLGAGFYYYDGIKGNTAPYANGVLGNSHNDGFYTEDYAIADAFAEIKFADVMGKPFTAAAILAYNTAASSDNFAYELGVGLGETKNDYDWKVGYVYRDIQKDAVFGAHNDSDFIGGGTDGKGHILTAGMRLNKHLDIGGTFIVATLNDSRSATGVKADYNRLQLDATIKF